MWLLSRRDDDALRRRFTRVDVPGSPGGARTREGTRMTPHEPPASPHGSRRTSLLVVGAAAALLLVGAALSANLGLGGTASPDRPGGGAGLARGSQEPSRASGRSAPTSPPAQRLTVAQFFGNIQPTAYEKVGRKNPRWDNEAKHFLSLFSTNFLRGAVAVTTEPAGMGTAIWPAWQKPH